MKRQRSRGSAIAETGPALFMFFVIVFFPLLNVFGVAGQYAVGWYHNHLMLQELPLHLENETGGIRNSGTMVNGSGNGVHNNVYNRFIRTGFANFVRVRQIQDVVVYDNAVQPNMVRCTTTLTGQPFIPIPVVGFNSTRFTISGEATREVVDRRLVP